MMNSHYPMYTHPYNQGNAFPPNPYMQRPPTYYNQGSLYHPSMQQLLQNPLEPEQMMYGNQNMYMPKTPASVKKQPQMLGQVLNSFKTEDGNYDVNKMVSTTGQLVNIVSQVSSVAKGIGSFFIKI